MPTVARINGLRVVIYPNDHRPAHVHVIGADSEAVFVLNRPEGPLEIRESFGLNAPDMGVIVKQISKLIPALCVAWSEIHG